MTKASRLITAAALSLGIALLGFAATARADEQAERLAHWQDIATLLFGARRCGKAQKCDAKGKRRRCHEP